MSVESAHASRARSAAKRPVDLTGGCLCGVGAGGGGVRHDARVERGSRQVVADLGPNPPENPSVSAPWPDFSDKVLHWQNYSYSWDPASPDHSNGQEIKGEIWVQVGLDNRPVAMRGTFFHADGSFHQDYLYVDGRGIVVYDEPILDQDGNPQTDPCREESTFDKVRFAELVDTGEPLFLDRAKASSLGFARSDAPPAAVPLLEPADVGVASEDVIGNGAKTTEAWVLESPGESGSTRVDILGLDADGRLAVETHSERLAGGGEVVRQRLISTAVEVFSAQDAAVRSVFNSVALREGCGG